MFFHSPSPTFMRRCRMRPASPDASHILASLSQPSCAYTRPVWLSALDFCASLSQPPFSDAFDGRLCWMLWILVAQSLSLHAQPPLAAGLAGCFGFLRLALPTFMHRCHWQLTRLDALHCDASLSQLSCTYTKCAQLTWMLCILMHHLSNFHAHKQMATGFATCI